MPGHAETGPKYVTVITLTGWIQAGVVDCQAQIMFDRFRAIVALLRAALIGSN